MNDPTRAKLEILVQREKLLMDKFFVSSTYDTELRNELKVSLEQVRKQIDELLKSWV